MKIWSAGGLLLGLFVAPSLGAFPCDRAADACTLRAAPLTGSIRLDGRLDEPDWTMADAATDFRQREPQEGAPASMRTEVRILYGADALYVGARLFDSEPGRIEAALGRRDEVNRADWFFVSIDGYRGKRTAYFFGVNAAGVQADGTVTGQQEDTSWNAIWEAQVTRDEAGWTAELRIPYAMLRFSRADVQTWGINFERYVPRLDERSEWSLVRQSDRGQGVVAGYGALSGLRGLRPRRNVQVAPYAVARGASGPAREARDAEADAGADARIGLAPNVTLDLTVNPDFGQVESDPAVLNLTAFETFLPERRPFFVEGADVLRFGEGGGGGPNEISLLYTRRIGAGAPILGAAKVTGRTAGGLSFGSLAALEGDAIGAPRAYAATRLRQEFGQQSRLGGIVTYFDASPQVSAPRRALAAGVDWDARLAANTYSFNGRGALTHRVLPGNPVRTGVALNAGIGRVRGNWRYGLTGDFKDAHFNPNDLGRSNRNNTVGVSGRLEHELNDGRPFGPFRRGSARVFGGNSFTVREGYNQGLGLFAFLNLQTRGFSNISGRLTSDFLLGGVDAYETRGLGPIERPRRASLNVSVTTDTRRSWQLEPRLELQTDAAGRGAVEVGLEGEWAVGSRVQLSAEASVGAEQGALAWAANESLRRFETGWRIGPSGRNPARLKDADYAAFDDRGTLAAVLTGVAPFDASGAYYVPIVGFRDARSADLTTRATLTFTRSLTLQLYGQLFAARGRYARLAVLARPDERRPFDAYPKRLQFSDASFQSNAVLRWEYRPGSALFVVWTQARETDDAYNPLDAQAPDFFGRSTLGQLADGLGRPAQHVLMVKLSYLFLR
jgi:hypothetical protein